MSINISQAFTQINLIIFKCDLLLHFFNISYYKSMERVFNKFMSFDEQEEHEILEYVRMTIEERQAIAFELKKRAYGRNVPDVREFHKKQ